MARIIKSHGFAFAVEGDGFIKANAIDDLETACANLKDALDDLGPEEVARLHAGAKLDPETQECRSGDARNKLYNLASDACDQATVGWFNPSAFIMVSAC